ncbi:porin [Trinickia mobilis]|uniref:porin n=1 Tax=Trinickia mobilis TaxID=2816356 RepID=UPI001A8FF108|nr:porin [Trinickia mobilis]
MKIRSTVIATTGLLVVAAAHAQSSVTLYGVIDTGVMYVSGQKSSTGAGSSNWLINSGTLTTPRWGLRGNEDLGGGLSAIFWLENGFNSSTGTLRNGGTFFGRQAAVGIQSQQFGALTLGRQYDFLVNYLQPLSGAGAGGLGNNIAIHPFDNDNIGNNVRINNSVKFSSTSFGGLKVGAMYAFSGAAGGFGNGSAYSGGASYSYGPLDFAAAYLQINGTRVAGSAGGATSTSDFDAESLGGRQQIYGAGVKYRIGESSIGLLWTHSSINNPTGIIQGASSYVVLPSGSSNLKFDNFDISGRYLVRPNLSLAAYYSYTIGELSSATHGARPHWNQVMGQVDYLFSKRTDVYFEGLYQTVGGGNGLSVFNAEVGVLPPSATGSQLVVGAGIRHRF